MLSRIIIACCLIALPLAGNAQCSAYFSWTSTGLTATFNSVTFPQAGPNTMYYWWFSDNNNSSTMQNPVYTFSAPGTYNVCFSYYDSSTGCQDSICQMVTVPQTSCVADFTWLDTMGYTYFYSTTSIASGAYYAWNFGDGNYSNLQNPSNVYLNPGTYTACLHVFDSNMVFCDSACHTITVQGSGGCNADFTWLDSLGYYFFFGYSSIGNTGYYVWDFGDGGYSYMQNPSYQYNVPGYYTVCVQVYDSNQVFCDSACHMIYVQQVNVEETILQQSFNVSPNPGDEMLQLSFNCSTTGAAAITFYDATGRATQMKTTAIHQTGYNKIDMNTTEMPQGIYLIKLEMNGTVAWKKIALTHQ